MLKLEQISPGQKVNGIEQGRIVRIVSTEKLGEHAINAIYRDGSGRLGVRMLFPSDEPGISLAESGCPWSFCPRELHCKQYAKLINGHSPLPHI